MESLNLQQKKKLPFVWELSLFFGHFVFFSTALGSKRTTLKGIGCPNIDLG